jgi:predicted DNA-binding transcriptional regulator YafY
MEIIIVIIIAIFILTKITDEISSKKRIKRINDVVLYKRLISEAIKNNQDLILKYNSSKGEITTRKITPVGFENHEDNHGKMQNYLNADCHLRNAERQFKINRILHVEIIDKE